MKKKAAPAKNLWRKGDAQEVRLAVMKLRVSARKVRLHSVACCRSVAKHIRHADCRALIDLLERRADDGSLADAVSALRRKVKRWAESTGPFVQSIDWYARFAVWASAEPQPRAPVPGFSYRYTFRDILAEILGPRDGVVPFSPDWRTDTAVALAQGMYESRDFSAMPILADALQDAGCDSDTILSHCRDATASHARGCWVVDLVLGKS